MSEFHRIFGDRLMLIAEQLRGCGNQDAKYIYDREKDEVDSTGMIQATIVNLWSLDRGLPQNEDQIQCANK
jgi:hypothetical protein